MRILTAHIYGYGKLNSRTFEFNPGMNIVSGLNESGKSTLMSFLKSMLYGHKKNEREGKDGNIPEYKKYKPWHCPDYGGYITLETDNGDILRIERDFERKTLKIFDQLNNDITSEFSFSKDSEMPGQDLLGMDADCFLNSAFIKQDNTVLGPDQKDHLANMLVNMSESGQQDISVNKSLDILKKFKLSLGNDNTFNRPFNVLNDKLDKETDILEQMQNKNEHCIQFLNQEKELNAQLFALEQKKAGAINEQVYQQTKKTLNECKQYEAEIHAINSEEDIKKTGKTKKTKIIRDTVLYLTILIALLSVGFWLYFKKSEHLLWALLCVPGIASYIPLYLKHKKAVAEQSINTDENKSENKLIGHYEQLIQKILQENDVSDLESLEDKLEYFEVKNDRNTSDPGDVQQDIDYKKQEIAIVASNIKKYYSQEWQIAEQQEKIDGLEREISNLVFLSKASDIAKDGIQQAARMIKLYIMPEINDTMSEYINRLTAGAHDNIKAGDGLSMSVEFESRIRSINSFSTGTLNQMYLSFRLAAADVFSGKGLCPIFMDEALVYYDRQRKEATLELISELSESRQIVYFSTDADDLNMIKEGSGHIKL